MRGEPVAGLWYAGARWVQSGDGTELPLPVVTEQRESLTTLKQMYYESGATLIHAASCRL